VLANIISRDSWVQATLLDDLTKLGFKVKQKLEVVSQPISIEPSMKADLLILDATELNEPLQLNLSPPVTSLRVLGLISASQALDLEAWLHAGLDDLLVLPMTSSQLTSKLTSIGFQFPIEESN